MNDDVVERQVRALVFEAVIQASQPEVVNAPFAERQEVRKEIADEWGEAILSAARTPLAEKDREIAGLRELAADLIEIEAEAEHLPEPASHAILDLVDRARQALALTKDASHAKG